MPESIEELKHEHVFLGADHERNERKVWLVIALTAAAWISEPFHGVGAPVIALAVAGVLFATGLLVKQDLADIDWATLGLIAGGIMVGRLIEASGLLDQWAAAIGWDELPRTAALALLIGSAAMLSAVMSNTAAVAMLIPLAVRLDPSASVAVLLAIGERGYRDSIRTGADRRRHAAEIRPEGYCQQQRLSKPRKIRQLAKDGTNDSEHHRGSGNVRHPHGKSRGHQQDQKNERALAAV